MVRILFVPFFLRFLLNVHIPDADGNESATGISRALGMALIGWRQSADTMSDWVIESMQEIVSELKKEQRRLFLYRCPRRHSGNTERDLQATSYSKTSGTGFHLQIRGRTITSRVNLGIAERGHGGLKVTRYAEWKSSGANSLLWIHGKRQYFALYSFLN
jgi:hypothetical protein